MSKEPSLIVIDECSQIDPSVFESIKNICPSIKNQSIIKTDRGSNWLASFRDYAKLPR